MRFGGTDGDFIPGRQFSHHQVVSIAAVLLGVTLQQALAGGGENIDMVAVTHVGEHGIGQLLYQRNALGIRFLVTRQRAVDLDVTIAVYRNLHFLQVQQQLFAGCFIEFDALGFEALDNFVIQRSKLLLDGIGEITHATLDIALGVGHDIHFGGKIDTVVERQVLRIEAVDYFLVVAEKTEVGVKIRIQLAVDAGFDLASDTFVDFPSG